MTRMVAIFTMNGLTFGLIKVKQFRGYLFSTQRARGPRFGAKIFSAKLRHRRGKKICYDYQLGLGLRPGLRLSRRSRRLPSYTFVPKPSHLFTNFQPKSYNKAQLRILRSFFYLLEESKQLSWRSGRRRVPRLFNSLEGVWLKSRFFGSNFGYSYESRRVRKSKSKLKRSLVRNFITPVALLPQESLFRFLRHVGYYYFNGSRVKNFDHYIRDFFLASVTADFKKKVSPVWSKRHLYYYYLAEFKQERKEDFFWSQAQRSKNISFGLVTVAPNKKKLKLKVVRTRGLKRILPLARLCRRHKEFFMRQKSGATRRKQKMLFSKLFLPLRVARFQSNKLRAMLRLSHKSGIIASVVLWRVSQLLVQHIPLQSQTTLTPLSREALFFLEQFDLPYDLSQTWDFNAALALSSRRYGSTLRSRGRIFKAMVRGSVQCHFLFNNLRLTLLGRPLALNLNLNGARARALDQSSQLSLRTLLNLLLGCRQSLARLFLSSYFLAVKVGPASSREYASYCHYFMRFYNVFLRWALKGGYPGWQPKTQAGKNSKFVRFLLAWLSTNDERRSLFYLGFSYLKQASPSKQRQLCSLLARRRRPSFKYVTSRALRPKAREPLYTKSALSPDYIGAKLLRFRHLHKAYMKNHIFSFAQAHQLFKVRLKRRSAFFNLYLKTKKATLVAANMKAKDSLYLRAYLRFYGHKLTAQKKLGKGAKGGEPQVKGFHKKFQRKYKKRGKDAPVNTKLFPHKRKKLAMYRKALYFQKYRWSILRRNPVKFLQNKGKKLHSRFLFYLKFLARLKKKKRLSVASLLAVRKLTNGLRTYAKKNIYSFARKDYTKYRPVWHNVRGTILYPARVSLRKKQHKKRINHMRRPLYTSLLRYQKHFRAFFFNMSVTQLKHTVHNSVRLYGRNFYNFLLVLERRADNLLYRYNYAANFDEARALVNSGRVFVDGSVCCDSRKTIARASVLMVKLPATFTPIFNVHNLSLGRRLLFLGLVADYKSLRFILRKRLVKLYFLSRVVIPRYSEAFVLGEKLLFSSKVRHFIFAKLTYTLLSRPVAAARTGAVKSFKALGQRSLAVICTPAASGVHEAQLCIRANGASALVYNPGQARFYFKNMSAGAGKGGELLLWNSFKLSAKLPALFSVLTGAVVPLVKKKVTLDLRKCLALSLSQSLSLRHSYLTQDQPFASPSGAVVYNNFLAKTKRYRQNSYRETNELIKTTLAFRNPTVKELSYPFPVILYFIYYYFRRYS